MFWRRMESKLSMDWRILDGNKPKKLGGHTSEVMRMTVGIQDHTVSAFEWEGTTKGILVCLSIHPCIGNGRNHLQSMQGTSCLLYCMSMSLAWLKRRVQVTERLRERFFGCDVELQSDQYYKRIWSRDVTDLDYHDDTGIESIQDVFNRMQALVTVTIHR